MTSQGFTIFGDLRTTELTPVAGWTHAYSVNSELVDTTLTGSGTVTQSDAMAVLSTGAATSSSARIETKRVLRYLPGLGGLARFTTIFSTPVVGNTQYVGLGTAENGFFQGFTDTDFCIVRRSDSVDYVVTSDNFNFVFNTTLDFTKGNVFAISYQWLGFGLISFHYENPITHEFVPFHYIKYPNTAIAPSLINPTMPIFAEVKNTTNNTDIVLKTPSAMAFREGMYIPTVDPLVLLRGFNNESTISTEVPIISIRAKSTYQGITNLIHPLVSALSLASDGTKNVHIKLYRGGTLTGASWVDYSTNTSSLEYDITASALSNANFIFDYHLARNDSFTDKIAGWNLSLAPDEIFTITATSASSNDVSCSVLMEEPF